MTSNRQADAAAEPYLNYNSILKNRFAERIQKISINAGFTCPNRDGQLGRGGCTYCNNQAFVPEYCQPHKSVAQQIEEGIAFFAHKYHSQLYLAYFQSYTNTYGELDTLIATYKEALKNPKVAGLVVGTRPDCVSPEILRWFAQLSKTHYVMLEYGVESTDNQTLAFINRGHGFACTQQAIRQTAALGINTAAHLILGLPTESRQTMLSHAQKLSELPLTALKIHQLQIIRGTKMAQQFADNPQIFHLFSLGEYIDLCIDFLEVLNPKIAVERFVSQSPPELLLTPNWGVKNFEFNALLLRRFAERNTFQGKKFCSNNFFVSLPPEKPTK